jgi:hypothetical protein
MYYANTIMIDGLEIITGIDKKQIDRVETEKKIKLQVEELKEFKAIKTRNEKSKLYNANIQSAVKAQKAIIDTVAIFKQIPAGVVTDDDLTFQQREKMKVLKEKINFNKAQINELLKDLPALTEQLKQKKTQLLRENASYFEMPINTIGLSENQAKEYSDILNNNNIIYKKTKVKKLLTIDGNIIIDYRGEKVWSRVGNKWTSRVIAALTDRIDILEIMDIDLTDEQKQEIAEQEETERINSLSMEEKENEISTFKESLLAQSINMKSKLEIQGDKEALKKSQEWYNLELLKLNGKYD